MATTYYQALILILGACFVAWIYSVYRRDVSIVDSLWPLMLLISAIWYYANGDANDLKSLIFLLLVTTWALRLSVHLTFRNWGEAEDRRYQEIRKNNSPYFAIKSLYIVFGLQGVLAWIISTPLLLNLSSNTTFTLLDYVGISLWITGFIFEAVADWQLLHYKKTESTQSGVLSSGLWRYSRHPNYFGEFLMWWGYYLFALSAGGWWTIYAPLLMTWLLLKVSGVVLMEKDIQGHRPAYQQYIEQTNAFIPGTPRYSKRRKAEGVSP